ncbi:MAG TPA: NAD(P)-binding domain-containing protein, partial [Acidobacteriaceae bacterium]|nr:NAD(P)-binding domain-containing protein [Acidobacteriaceae bacterium]
MKSKIGVLGSGSVAQTLAAGFEKHGHSVMIGTRDTQKLQEWSTQNRGVSVGSFSEAASFGEIVILAVKGTASAKALGLAGAGNLAGKVVIDATNPMTDAPPEKGVLKFFTSLDESMMERLQREFPDARLVKAFNSVGANNFIDPKFAEGRPTMFICGNDEAAKKTVTALLDQVGWDSADMGEAIA